MKKEKVLVGFSGGIDSTFTLYLLKKQDFEPVALTLKFLGVLSGKKLSEARKITKRLGVKHIVLDASEIFQKRVVNYFLKEAKNLNTPNPCVICNRFFKFETLFKVASELKIKKVATGHYARIIFNNETKEFELWRARGKSKDQSYFLIYLKRKWLKDIILPMGETTRKKAEKMVRDLGFNSAFESSSQDLCFLKGENKNDFLSKHLFCREGDIVLEDGIVVGRHKGLCFYTLGQRRDIGLSGGPYYVVGFDKKNNYLIVSKKKDKVFKKNILLKKVNFLIKNPFLNKKSMKIRAKTRYRSELVEAELSKADRYFKVIFKKPVFAPTPGQFAAFYDLKNDKLLGGGEIFKIET